MSSLARPGLRTLAGFASFSGAGLLVVAAMTVPAVAKDGEGWAEVRSSRPAALAPLQSGGGRTGDRLWMSRAGDSFASIAQRTTGSAVHAGSIARYNRHAVDAVLPTDTLLYVPSSLLPGQPAVSASRYGSSGGAAAGSAGGTSAEPGGARVTAPVAASVAWEIREFETPAEPRIGPEFEPKADPRSDSTADAPIPERVFDGPAVRPVNGVNRERVDLFAGEVSVLGEVEVSRVAIGNGDIVRAEVLDGGELLVIAQSAGSSSLRLWHRDGRQSDYNIRVSDKDPETRVRMERMVRMRVRMVEFRKSALGRLGIDWADGAAGPGFATAGDAIGNNLFRPAVQGFDGLPNTVQPFSTYFGIASNITSRINFMASNGDATTLAEPVLTAANGGSASFLAGGEVPYPSVGDNGQTVVQFKEYGIRLEVAPRIDSAGNVRTVVETEISQLDPAVSVQGAPGLLTRRAQTEVNVRSGETIVISGLLSSESSRDVDRLPGIGRLPIIGAFFRSTNRRDTVTELVIFLTPEVVDPADASLEQADRQRFEASTRSLRSARSTLPLLD